jgi:hypothetical protein
MANAPPVDKRSVAIEGESFIFGKVNHVSFALLVVKKTQYVAHANRCFSDLVDDKSRSFFDVTVTNAADNIQMAVYPILTQTNARPKRQKVASNVDVQAAYLSKQPRTISFRLRCPILRTIEIAHQCCWRAAEDKSANTHVDETACRSS